MPLNTLDSPAIIGIITRTMNFREKLPILKAQHRYSTPALAKALGIVDATVRRWDSPNPEHQGREPTPAQYLAMARLFRVTLESLIDDNLPIMPSEPPVDEQVVLDTYRRLKMTEGLTATDASIRMAKPQPQFRPYFPPDDSKASRQ